MTLQHLMRQHLTNARGGIRTLTRLPGGDFKAPLPSRRDNGLAALPSERASQSSGLIGFNRVRSATDSATTRCSTRHLVGGAR